MDRLFRFLDKYGENVKDIIFLGAVSIGLLGLIAIKIPEIPWQLQGLGAVGLLLSIPIIVTFGLSKSTWN